MSITYSFRLFDLEEHMSYGRHILHWKSYLSQIKKTQLIVYTVDRIKVDRRNAAPPTPLWTQWYAILPIYKTDLFAEWIDGSIILEHFFNHFQIKKNNVYLHVYQTKFEWWYVVQLQETLFNGVSFNFFGLPIWALYTVRLWEIRNHKISFLTNYFYYLLFRVSLCCIPSITPYPFFFHCILLNVLGKKYIKIMLLYY